MTYRKYKYVMGIVYNVVAVLFVFAMMYVPELLLRYKGVIGEVDDGFYVMGAVIGVWFVFFTRGIFRNIEAEIYSMTIMASIIGALVVSQSYVLVGPTITFLVMSHIFVFIAKVFHKIDVETVTEKYISSTPETTYAIFDTDPGTSELKNGMIWFNRKENVYKYFRDGNISYITMNANTPSHNIELNGMYAYFRHIPFLLLDRDPRFLVPGLRWYSKEQGTFKICMPHNSIVYAIEGDITDIGHGVWMDGNGVCFKYHSDIPDVQ